MSKPILCLDFDGVLHTYTSGWKGATIVADPPVSGMVSFLCRAVDQFDVHIFSSRTHQVGGLSAMRAWLLKWHVPEQVVAELSFPIAKPSAHVSLDDRAITFTGTWPSMTELQEFTPWNKKCAMRETLGALVGRVAHAIEAGDWKVDAACDPEVLLARARKLLGIQS